MIRSATPLPPSCVATELTTIVSGIVAVSALEASAIERSKPAIFWKRLRTRSTNSGRSQNVSVRTTRSRVGCSRGLRGLESSTVMRAGREIDRGYVARAAPPRGVRVGAHGGGLVPVQYIPERIPHVRRAD